MQGTILAVTSAPAGGELDTAALTGATSLTLVNVNEFDTTTGGNVEINGVIYTYSSINPTTLVMTLTTGLATDMDAGQRVNLSPLVIEKWATVEVQADDDAILVLVPHSLWDRIDEGVRDPEDQEPVIVEQQNGDWVVADVIGTQPLQSGEFIDPGTAPTPTDVGNALDDLRAQVSAHGAAIDTNTADIENVEETAFDAGSLASIADIRTTLSDYEPSPADAVGRADGSMWVTRTRARTNLITNPSFEVDTSGWFASQTVMLREASASIISGSYTCKLTNSGVAASHNMSYDTGGTNRIAVTPGQIITGSCYALAVSGTNNGVYAQFDFYTSGMTFIGTYASTAANPLGGTYGSPATVLSTTDWARLYLTVPAPATAAYVTFSLISPVGNESAVWRVDGAVLEADDILGRYFDGRSYDGSWSGVADLSISSLAGGAIVKIFELDNGGWIQRWYTGTAIADVDASTITHASLKADGTVGLSGTLITDRTIPIDKISGTPIVASEALTAGDIVNVYNTGGLFRMQKANAGTALKPASGFVLNDVVSGTIGFAYSAGYNPYVTGLVPGSQFLSNVAGKCGGTPPATVGSLIQPVGFAGGATVLNFTAGTAIYIV